MSSPLRKKRKPKAARNLKSAASPIPGGLEKENLPAPAQGFNDQRVILLLLVAALFLFARTNAPNWIRVFLVLALVFQTAKILRGTRFHLPERSPLPSAPGEIKSPLKSPAFLVISLGLFSIALLGLPSFNWIAPFFQKIPLNLVYSALPILWVGMVFFFRRSPEKTAAEDFSSRTARFLLFVVLSLGAYMRLCQGTSPIGFYGEDAAAAIQEVRHVTELRDFRNQFIFQIAGVHEPFFDYFSMFLWKLFPWMTSLMNQRITGVLIDLAVIWLLYLIGKDMVNRRTGIWMAALGALSKPLIMRSLQGLSLMSLSLGVAMALLFFLRLIRQPTLSRFVQWGAALSLGIYTFASFRPLVPFFIYATLIWVWRRENKEGNLGGQAKLLLGTTAGLLLFYFLYANNFISLSSWFGFYNDLVPYGLPALALALYSTLALSVFIKTKIHEKNVIWPGWLAGSWLCVVFTFPILMNDSIQTKLIDIALAKNASSNWDFLSKVWGQVNSALRRLFLGGNDRLDIFIPNDTFFSYSEIVLIALGLAYFVGKPNWKKTLLALTAIVGFSMYAFVRDPHTGWLIGCIVPLIALGGIGLEAFWREFSGLFKGGDRSKWAYALLICFWVWTANNNLTRIYQQWFFKYVNKYTVVNGEAKKEVEKGLPVYVTSSLLGGWIGSVLYEGNSVRLFNTSNSLFLGPSEKPSGVSLYLDSSEINLRDQLQRAYPTGQWTEVRGGKESADTTVMAYHGFVPLPDVAYYSEQYQKLQQKYARLVSRHQLVPSTPLPPTPMAPPFEIRQVASPYWSRSFSSGKNGLGLAILDGEDKTVNARDALPTGINADGEAVLLESVIRTQKQGKYEISLKTDNLTKVWVDGRKIFDVSFYLGRRFNTELVMEAEKNLEKTIQLDATDHHIKILTYFQKSTKIPNIGLHPKGSAEPEKSIWSSFSF